MSINMVLPEGIERRARELKDNDLFVDAVWSAFAGYHDLSGIESIAVTKEVAKGRLSAVRKDIRKLRGSIQLAADLYPPPTELLHDLGRMERHYSGLEEHLDGIDGRQSKNRALRWLVRRLLGTFEAYEVPQHKLSGFIHDCLPFQVDRANRSEQEIEVELAKLPSRKTIGNVLKENRS